MGALVLRGLGADIAEALTRVAVIGVEFDTDEFVALSRLPEDRAYDLLDGALAATAVERTGVGYRFRHALVREALLEGLPPHRLLPLHRAAAESLTRLGASPARIGRQWLQAGDVGAAAPHLLRAARAEAAVGAHRDALELVDSVRADVGGPERGELLEIRADMLLAMGDAGAVVAYREAIVATAVPDRRRRIQPRLARAATFAGDYATAAEALDGLEPDGTADDAALLLARGNLAYLTGDLDAAAGRRTRRGVGWASLTRVIGGCTTSFRCRAWSPT